MPWKETAPMTERLQCITADLNQVYSMTELCERVGIRRNTGYQWVRRYTEQGPAGLQEKSRAPHRGPPRMAEEGEAVLWEATQAHPPWGPRKIPPSLARPRPALHLPAPSPAGALFQRAGLSQARTRRRRPRPPGASPLQAEAPKAVWTAAFNGQFRPGDGRSGSPLAVADADSRFRFSCSARLSTRQVEARPRFERLCRECGRPDALRTDNGAPFAPPACCGRSTRSVGWMKRGLRHQRLDPGRPEQQGRHERRHRTLKAEATRPPAPHQRARQARCARVCRQDTEARPPEALTSRTPASLDQPSARPRPAQLPAPAYPGRSLVRRVSHAGTVRSQTRQLFIRATLLQEDSALEETAEGLWAISFYAVLLARRDERDCTLYP